MSIIVIHSSFSLSFIPQLVTLGYGKFIFRFGI